MNKSDLIKAIAAGAGVTDVVATAALNTFTEIVQGELAGDREVALHGIGKLTVKDVPARVGRNPKTGEPIEIPAKRKVAFKAAKGLGH